MGRVVYASGALQALRRMPANTARTIRTKIEQYADDPASLANNVKKLKGRPGYRLPVGDWRVLFEREGRDLTILAIGPCGGIYER
jgi:mRNA interferase RelE/StbE